MKNIFSQIKKGFGLPDSSSTDSTTEKPTAKKEAGSNFSIPAANARREEVIRFILKAMAPYTDEKTQPVAGIRLYYKSSDPVQQQITHVALYLDDPSLFRQEHLERKLNDHFIPLDAYWSFECQQVKDEFPQNIFVQDGLGLEVLHRGQAATGPYTEARIFVLTGKAEKEEYILNPMDKLKFNIGRSSNPQLSSGKMQYNDIVFPGREDPSFDEKKSKPNLHVSRNHAYILFNPQANKYYLYADKGGLPENGNKVKIHTVNDQIKILSIPGVGHELIDGDQIELGGEVLLLFKLSEGGRGEK